MKKILFVLLASAFAFAACEEINETYADPAQQLEVSSANVVFNADGGAKTVLVTSNVDWICSVSETWCDVEQGDGTLVIYADANATGANRYATITVSTDELSETVSVAQTMAVDESTDLSDGETANCYIASTGTSCRFNALVKGNGKTVDFGGIAAYVEKYGTTIDPSDIVYADLLWEAALDADKTRTRNIIADTPLYSDGYVYFTTGPAEGNAVIAVKDAQGTVLWSWHIWVTDQEIAETEGNGYHWMDRNLGANSCEPLDVNNRGLLYQWGRKDPFLPSYAAYGAENADLQNEDVGKGSGEWIYTDFVTKYQTEAPGNIELSVQNPMSVLIANGASVYSWYLTATGDDLYNAYLWGRSDDLSTYVKSIFDPCPAGYNVPVDNPWISGKDSSVNMWTAGGDYYGRYWTGGGDAFYPLCGAILGTTGALSGTSVYGYYWTSAKYSNDTAYTGCYLYFNISSTLYYSYTYPAHAMAVRCMRAE